MRKGFCMSIHGLIKRSLLFGSAIYLAHCLGLSAEQEDNPIKPAPSLPKTTPWNLAALSEPPTFQWLHRTGGVWSLLYEGEPYKGKPTRVFAYYGTPGTLRGRASEDIDLPGVVLVHGGGGRAFKEWVELWANRGYAAIAMDLAGCGPDGKRLSDGGPGQSDEDKFGRIDGPVADQWSYHAAANVVLAHSLICSFKEVDAQRTAVTGISWGGYLTCIVAGLDNRFKAAVPVYGCGFLDENSCWLPRFGRMSPEHREKWVQLFDPSMYIGSATMPVFFVNGTNDFAYPLDSYAKTYLRVKGARNLRITIRMSHSHRDGWKPEEIGLFIDQYVKAGTPLPTVKRPKVIDGQVHAEVATETKLSSASLNYTTGTGPVNKRTWQTKRAKTEGSRIIAERPPADATIWFLTVTDQRKALVSSELVFCETPISKKGIRHHLSPLNDSTRMTGFALNHTGSGATKDTSAEPGRTKEIPASFMVDDSRDTRGSLTSLSSNILFRGSLNNSRIQFEKHKKGHVVFMGGSITEMNGYRPMVSAILTKRFPDTDFTFTNAGISSTCSTTGAFRLETDILGKGPVDLFFIEFAVNDDQDAAHTRRECIRGMEGIIRHARRHNPYVDIVIIYFVNPAMMKTCQAGNTPLTIASHEQAAKHYGIPASNLAKEVAERIASGTLTWEKFGGTHPAPFGNAICAGMIDDLLSPAWSKPLPADATKIPHPMPKQPLDSFSYINGRFVDPKQAVIKHGWKLLTPPWKKLKGECRRRFTKTPMLCADRPGAELTLGFTGAAVGAYILAGPDAGIVEASVDGMPFNDVNLFHRFSKNLHYPRTVMFATDLKPAKHTLRLRIAEKTYTSGHAMRIMEFAVN